MRSRKVTVHYCDHCNKRGFQIPAMQKHEKSCTANPDRVCGMCEWMYENDDAIPHGKSVAELLVIAGSGNSEGLKKVREATNNCPACILAVSRMARKQYCCSIDAFETGNEKVFYGFDEDSFDWVAELGVWQERSREIMSEQQYVGGWY